MTTSSTTRAPAAAHRRRPWPRDAVERAARPLRCRRTRAPLRRMRRASKSFRVAKGGGSEPAASQPPDGLVGAAAHCGGALRLEPALELHNGPVGGLAADGGRATAALNAV